MARASFDVVVVGGGLAGISTALSACASGASVALVCDTTLCSGSSFSRNTWGLGMISEAPEPFTQGHQSLFKAIESIGMTLSTPGLPERLTRDAAESIEWLAGQGAKLRAPDDVAQREYVPCFDKEVRTWRGFLAQDSKEALTQCVQTSGIQLFEHTLLVTLLIDKDRRVGGILTLHKNSESLLLRASSVVLCCGGLAGLYASHICPSTTGIGHLAAIEAGASLTNIEFQQLMVGYLEPLHGVVFNEKLWRWVRLWREESYGSLSPTAEELQEAQEAHSWHGPFTAERTSKLVERFICEVSRGRTYTQIDQAALNHNRPELIDEYLQWLQEEHHVSAAEKIPVALFAHSSNGGIAIDEDGFTGVQGLYVAGEMAGGVHGADRVGGLASVSAVVFGRHAGKAAAKYSRHGRPSHDTAAPTIPLCVLAQSAQSRLDELRQELDSHALVPRTEFGLRHVRDTAQACLEWIEAHSTPVKGGSENLSNETMRRVVTWQEARSQAMMTKTLAMAMLARTETRGSHFRSDFPNLDSAQNHQLHVYLRTDGEISVAQA